MRKLAVSTLLVAAFFPPWKLFIERIEHQPFCSHWLKFTGSAADEGIHESGQRQEHDFAPATMDNSGSDANVRIVIPAVTDDGLDAGAGEHQAVAAGTLCF